MPVIDDEGDVHLNAGAKAGGGSVIFSTNGLERARIYPDGSVGGVIGNGPAIVTRPARPRPSSSLLTTFQPSHGWTLDATLSTDTVDFALGAQSIKFTTAGTGASNNLKSPLAGFTAVDLTAVDPIVWVKIDDFTHLSHFYLLLSSDNAYTTNAYRWDLQAAVSQEWCTPGQWTPVTLLKSDASVLGSPIGTSIQWAEFRAIDDNTGVATTAHVNMLGFQTKQASFPNGVVSFTFDDGRASQAAIAAPYLDKYAYAGNAFIIWSYLRDFLGSNAYMFKSDVDLLHRKGWEIGVHAFEGSRFHEPSNGWLNDSNGQTDIQKSKRAIADQGWTGYNTGAYPHGTWYLNNSGLVNGATSTGTILPAAREELAACRTTYPVSSLVAQGRMLHETLPPADPLRLRTGYVQNTTAVANVQSWIDEAKTDKSWLILTFHNIVASGASSSTDYLTADFQTIVDYVNSQGLEVRTVGQVLKGF